jgi:hypothetical protein
MIHVKQASKNAVAGLKFTFYLKATISGFSGLGN